MELPGLNVAGMAQTFGVLSLVCSKLVRRAKAKRKAKRVSPGERDHLAEPANLSTTPLAMTSQARPGRSTTRELLRRDPLSPDVKIQTYGINTHFETNLRD